MIAHIAFPSVTLAMLAAELGREAGHRASLYARKVEAAAMTQAAADRGLAIAAAWREDVERMIAAWSVGEPTKPPKHRFTWKERVTALQDELRLRRRFYPDWIAAGRLAQTDADRQRLCLEALLRIYHDGWDWRGGDGCLPCESERAQTEWRAHAAALDLARDPERQKEMTLG